MSISTSVYAFFFLLSAAASFLFFAVVQAHLVLLHLRFGLPQLVFHFLFRRHFGLQGLEAGLGPLHHVVLPVSEQATHQDDPNGQEGHRLNCATFHAFSLASVAFFGGSVPVN